MKIFKFFIFVTVWTVAAFIIHAHILDKQIAMLLFGSIVSVTAAIVLN